MSQAMFPMPGDERELVDLLNVAGENVSLFEKDGTGYGWLYEGVEQAGHPGQPCPYVEVYMGDQCMFQADTREEALVFLSAVFLMTFHGNSLDRIRRKAEEVKALDGYTAYQEMQKFHE